LTLFVLGSVLALLAFGVQQFGPTTPSEFPWPGRPSLTPAALNVFISLSLASFVSFLTAAGRLVVLLFQRDLTPEQRSDVLMGGVLGFVGFIAALGVLTLFSRGRQLRRGDALLLPTLKSGPDWTELPVAGGVATADVAQAWRENGRGEHASVAAFAQLTLDLMSVGAPPRLLADAQRDALDEVRHAELCFSLAKALDGAAQSPQPFPQAAKTRPLPPTRTLALARLAVDSLLEGALLEGYSARVIAKLTSRCADAATIRVLEELAADEGRHSRHGWDVVEWCLATGGTPIAQALRGAAAAIPNEPKVNADSAAARGEWERHGIAGAELERRTFSEARSYTVQRVDELTRQTLRNNAA
jgi:hypothetical protein